MKLINFDSLTEFAEHLPDEGEPVAIGRWINGRIISVLASPEIENSHHVATGVSVVPAGTSTPWHHHEAEEIAVIVAGAGEIEIDGVVFPVRAGDVVLTPPDLPHQTRAGAESALAVFWVYSPAGSEVRWLSENPVEEQR